MEICSSQLKIAHLQKISVDRKNSPKTLSKNLKQAAISGVIDVALCLEAANFIDCIIRDKQNRINDTFKFDQSDTDINYLVVLILKITRKSHQRILSYLLKNAGKIVNSEDICRECGTSQNTLKVQMSHLRSDLRKAGALNLLKSVRANSLCNESGYIIMLDELNKLKDNDQIMN